MRTISFRPRLLPTYLLLLEGPLPLSIVEWLMLGDSTTVERVLR